MSNEYFEDTISDLRDDIRALTEDLKIVTEERDRAYGALSDIEYTARKAQR